MTRVIERIPAQPGINFRRDEPTQQKIRLAAYARVSTNNEDQLDSFENQVQHYRDYQLNHPEYELVDIYADEGITGTNTRHREQFQRMIADCENRKIDMVITKSISRFARNTQDSLFYARKLKDLGIPIVFERENVNTMDGQGELLFTILSSLAQDESRSISENTTWGIRALFQQGVMHINTNRFLGYDKGKDGKLVINARQAITVRRIYREFLDGTDPGMIARNLTQDGVSGATGRTDWYSSTVMGILKNEKYKGDAILQKWFTPDYLNGKTIPNNGQVEKIYVKNDHEPIVSAEIWQATQLEIERREQFRSDYGIRTFGRYTDVKPFSSRVFCALCGSVYWRRTLQRYAGPMKVWQCGKRYGNKGHTDCASKNLNERTLYQGFVTAWNSILESHEARMPQWQKNAQSDNPLVALRARQMMELTDHAKPLTKIDFTLVGKVLEHVLVGGDGKLTFYLLDGTVV